MPDRIGDHRLQPRGQPAAGQRVKVGAQHPGRLGGPLVVAEADQAHRALTEHHRRERPAVRGQQAGHALAALAERGEISTDERVVVNVVTLNAPRLSSSRYAAIRLAVMKMPREPK